MKNSLSKAMADLEALIDIYGKDAILNALADIADINESTLSEGLGKKLVGPIAKALFNLLVKSAGTAGTVAAKSAGVVASKALDQDVHISSQGPVLKVTDPGLYDLISQTNALVKKTNDLLVGAEQAIEDSTRELEDIDFSIDDLIASGTPGVSTSDVKVRQAAKLSPETAAEEEEEIEEPAEDRI